MTEKRHGDGDDPRYHFLKKEVISLEEFNSPGWILDIGGGGEGVIGRWKGDRVVAIDPNEQELREAAPGPLKIVMDAGSMDFLDHSFNTVTAFYTLMYVADRTVRRQIFREVFRVLTPEGNFLIWDAMVPPRGENPKEIVVFPLEIRLPKETIETGYGLRWPREKIASTNYTGDAVDAGFQIMTQREEGRRLFLHLAKKL